MNSTTPSTHVSWTKIWIVIGALFVPGITVSTIIIRGGQQALDKLEVVSIKQDKQDNRMDKIEDKISAISTRVDTISHRQEINNITNNYRYLLQQHKTAVYPKAGYITQSR